MSDELGNNRVLEEFQEVLLKNLQDIYGPSIKAYKEILNTPNPLFMLATPGKISNLSAVELNILYRYTLLDSTINTLPDESEYSALNTLELDESSFVNDEEKIQHQQNAIKAVLKHRNGTNTPLTTMELAEAIILNLGGVAAKVAGIKDLVNLEIISAEEKFKQNHPTINWVPTPQVVSFLAGAKKLKESADAAAEASERQETPKIFQYMFDNLHRAGGPVHQGRELNEILEKMRLYKWMPLVIPATVEMKKIDPAGVNFKDVNLTNVKGLTPEKLATARNVHQAVGLTPEIVESAGQVQIKTLMSAIDHLAKAKDSSIEDKAMWKEAADGLKRAIGRKKITPINLQDAIFELLEITKGSDNIPAIPGVNAVLVIREKLANGYACDPKKITDWLKTERIKDIAEKVVDPDGHRRHRTVINNLKDNKKNAQEESIDFITETSSKLVYIASQLNFPPTSEVIAVVNEIQVQTSQLAMKGTEVVRNELLLKSVFALQDVGDALYKLINIKLAGDSEVSQKVTDHLEKEVKEHLEKALNTMNSAKGLVKDGTINTIRNTNKIVNTKLPGSKDEMTVNNDVSVHLKKSQEYLDNAEKAAGADITDKIKSGIIELRQMQPQISLLSITGKHPFYEAQRDIQSTLKEKLAQTEKLSHFPTVKRFQQDILFDSIATQRATAKTVIERDGKFKHSRIDELDSYEFTKLTRDATTLNKDTDIVNSAFGVNKMVSKQKFSKVVPELTIKNITDSKEKFAEKFPQGFFKSCKEAIYKAGKWVKKLFGGEVQNLEKPVVGEHTAALQKQRVNSEMKIPNDGFKK